MRAALRAAVPLAVVAGLAAAPAAMADQPHAKAAGSDVVTLTYPSIVQVRVDRTERALERATRKIENAQLDQAATTLQVVRRQMAAAWRGAKYVVRTTPPPPAEEARARASQDDATGPTYASPPDTAFRVLTLQHDVAGATAQLIDGSHGTGLAALSTTLYLTLDRRDQAIKDIVALAPPAPPVAEEGRVQARASQEEDAAAPTFDTVMPNMVPQLDDETQAIQGTLTDATDLTAGGRTLLNAAAAQVANTKTVVNATWPPIPQGD
jgi:hypothetical protein